MRLLTAWGTLHLVQGKLSAAERELTRAVELTATWRAEDRAAPLHNLAAVEMHLNRLVEAEAHEREALRIWREQYGERHYYVMKAWISLSSAQGMRGDWRAAEQSILQALRIEQSPEALANYAMVLDKLKRRAEARRIRAELRESTRAAPAVVDVKALGPKAAVPVRTR